MFKVYDPFHPFKVLARCKTLKEAFDQAKLYAHARGHEQWVEAPNGTLCGVARC